jgi:hypothetical protein
MMVLPSHWSSSSSSSSSWMMMTTLPSVAGVRHHHHHHPSLGRSASTLLRLGHMDGPPRLWCGRSHRLQLQPRQQEQQEQQRQGSIRPSLYGIAGASASPVGWGRRPSCRDGRAVVMASTRMATTEAAPHSDDDDDVGGRGLDGGGYHVLTTDDVVRYLEDVIEVVLGQGGGLEASDRNNVDDDDDDGSRTNTKFTLRLNEKHRKGMIRTIVGISKAEFKEQIRRIQVQEQWRRTRDFWTDTATGGGLLQEVVSPNDAPQFHETLRKYLTDTSLVPPFPEDGANTVTDVDDSGGAVRPIGDAYRYPNLPSKFFSVLARGRAYQGRFERLLGAVRPDLVGPYQAVVSDMPEPDLLHLFVEAIAAAPGPIGPDDDNDDTVELLHLCMGMSFVPPPRQAADGGRSAGQRGEINLSSYLRGAVDGTDTGGGCGDNNGSNNSNGTFRILSPVLVQPNKRKHGRRSKYTVGNTGGNQSTSNVTMVGTKAQYLLEIPEEAMAQGMTHEFDAMVVEQVQTQSPSSSTSAGHDGDPATAVPSSQALFIRQVWDAKATADTTAIHDVLTKKVESLRAILRHNNPPSSSSSAIQFVVLDPQATQSVQLFDVATDGTVLRDDGDDDNVDNVDNSNGLPSEKHSGDGPSGVRLPLIGIFANRMPPPKTAARSVQVAMCEMILETDRDVVRDVLRNGSGIMNGPTEAAVENLKRLVRKVQQTQPILVVARAAEQESRPR